MVLVVTLHSAALRLVEGRLLGETWEYLWDGGVAGQRLLGLVFQPSTFGVFLLLSLGLFVRGRAAWAVVAAALAASVHPTYLLSAAILVLAYCLVLWREQGGLRRPVLLGVFALALVTPIVLYVILALGPTSPDRIAEAQQILVHERVPHHALPAVWFDATVLVKLALLGLALFVTRTTPPRPGPCPRRRGGVAADRDSDLHPKRHAGAPLPVATIHCPRPGQRRPAGSLVVRLAGRERPGGCLPTRGDGSPLQPLPFWWYWPSSVLCSSPGSRRLKLGTPPRPCCARFAPASSWARST